jgi:hypothetical protein
MGADPGDSHTADIQWRAIDIYSGPPYDYCRVRLQWPTIDYTL